MKKTFLLTLGMAAAVLVNAQKNADWTKEFPSKINWYMITDAGTVMVATKDALYGVDPDGKEVWKADDIENIKEENVDLINGTPYVTLVKAKMFKGYNKVLDVVSGKMIVNTEDLGLQTVQKRLYLPESNKMLVYGGTKGGKLTTILVDLATGTKLWEQGSFFEKKSEQLVSKASEIGDGIFIATDKNIYKLNKQTGDVMYNIDMKSDLPVQPEEKASGWSAIGKSYGKTFGGRDASESQTVTSADFFQTYDKDKFYFWNQDNLTQFDVASGKETWSRFKLPSPIAYILHDSRGMIVATAEKRQEDIKKANDGGGGLVGRIKQGSAARKNRATLILLDPQTGNPKWNSEDVDLKGDILAYKLAGNKLILGTELDRGDNFISIVDLDAGKSVTKKPISIKGEIRDLQLVPQGLYFRTSEQINIADLESGDKTWKKGFKVKNCIGYNEDQNTGYVYGNGKVYKIDYKNGELNEWLQTLDFNRNEEPTTMGIYDNKIFISGDQNASLYNKDGKLIYHTYVEAPGRAMAGKILSGLGGAASMMMGAASAAQSAQLSYAKGYYGSTDAATDSKIKNSNNLAVAGIAGGIASFKSIARRFNATAQANGFVAMLTKFGSNQGKDAGITIVNKADGKRISDMLLGDKKDPDYKMDELEKVIYYRSGGNTIEGFKF